MHSYTLLRKNQMSQIGQAGHNKYERLKDTFTNLLPHSGQNNTLHFMHTGAGWVNNNF